MIALATNRTVAAINPQGAWLETLVSSDRPILFPKSGLPNETGETKTRGGMHVCLPNFGPGGDSGLAQHGFGRTSTWSIVQQEESSVVLELETTEKEYAGLHAALAYRLKDDSLTADLLLTNRRSSTLRVAPGFHPYFTVPPAETTVSVNDVPYRLNAIAGTEYIVAETTELRIANRVVRVTQENLTTWAIWTDQLSNYVCVEPTFGGNRFLETEQPDEQLAPGETKKYSVVISF